MAEFHSEEKKQVQGWLLDSFKAANTFDGSEPSEEKLFTALSLFDDFARTHRQGDNSIDWEQKIVETVFPDHPLKMPLTVDGFLDVASEFYTRLKDAESNIDIWQMLGNAGSVVHDSDKVFVKTDDGSLSVLSTDEPDHYEIKTEPRLAILIEHLRNDGVNGKPVYMDDLVVTRGKVATNMMRQLPYNIVQIPRLNMEIAVCDQIGETTFVKKGAVGVEFWDHLSKDQLKEREDVAHVDKRSDQQWWGEISGFLSSNADPSSKKVNIQNWANKPSKLDLELIKQCLLEHRQETGKWLASSNKKTGGKSGTYVLEYGAYAGMINSGSLNSALRLGTRGLPGKSSIADLNKVLSKEHGIEYEKFTEKKDLKLELIKESLLAHRLETGEWLAASKKEEGKSFVLKYGPYAGHISVVALDACLRNGGRGLLGNSSIPEINGEISDEHELDYENKFKKEKLDIDLIKESLLAHRQETGEWLSQTKKGSDGRSYTLEHGYYAGKLAVGAIDTALAVGLRGLPGGCSIAKLNQEISDEYDLDYVNKNALDDLNFDEVKESVLCHYQETGEWLRQGKTDSEGRSYVLEYGPCAGKISAQALESALRAGSRGLPSGFSIAKLNADISNMLGGDYTDSYRKEDLDIKKIKESLLAHYKEAGEWLTQAKRGSDGAVGTYILEHGPYAGEMNVAALNVALRCGVRGLEGGSSIATLNEEVSKEHGLDYENRFKKEKLDIDLLKESLLAHRQETGEWLSQTKKGSDGRKGTYILEHGPYASEVTVNTINNALFSGGRGFPKGHSIASLNEEVSKEHGLDYVNRLKKEKLDIDLIKQSLLAHYQETGEWLSAGKKGEEGESYVLEHGPYNDQLAVRSLNAALYKGRRGLPGRSSIAMLNNELKAELAQSLVEEDPQSDLNVQYDYGPEGME